MRGLDRILELQDLDTAIDRLEHRRGQLEAGEELSSLRKEMEEADARLGELRLASDSISSESTRLEHEIASMSDKLHAEEKRMYDGSIANAKELEALQHEIASVHKRRSDREDELLALLELRENLEAEAIAAEQQSAALRAGAEEAASAATDELARIGSDVADRTTHRAAIAAEIDPEVLELYDDLRRQKKGIGAAALVDGVCQACHEQLSSVELDKLKRAEGIRRCEHCRRILVV